MKKRVFFNKKNALFSTGVLFASEPDFLFNMGYNGTWQCLSKCLTYPRHFTGIQDKSKMIFFTENFRNSLFFFIPWTPAGPGQISISLEIVK